MNQRGYVGVSAAPVGLQGKASNQKRIILKPEDLMEFALLVLDLLRTYHSFWFLSHLEFKCLSYARPTIAFYKHITCLVSQISHWREILPQDELYISSHPDLI